MKTYVVLKNSAGCELARKDITGADTEGDFMTPVIEWICDDNIVINAGDTITIEEAA